MEYLCREVSKRKEARSCCWKEVKFFSKTMLGKGEPSASRFMDLCVQESVFDALERKKEKVSLPIESWKT